MGLISSLDYIFSQKSADDKPIVATQFLKNHEDIKVMSMSEKNLIILGVLANMTASLYFTTREIYGEMEPAEQGKFKRLDDVGAQLNKLFDSGLVEKGNSDIEKGVTRLTWRITNEGRKTLDSGAGNAAVAESINTPIATTDDDKGAEGEAELSVADNISADADLLAAFDNSMAIMRQAVVMVLHKEEIPNKDLMINTLEKLKQILSQDIVDVLAEIQGVIEKA